MVELIEVLAQKAKSGQVMMHIDGPVGSGTACELMPPVPHLLQSKLGV